MKRSIQPFLSNRVLVLNQNTPAQEAARALHERHVGCALVSDSHSHIVGLVTDRDLSSEVLGFGLAPDTPVEEIMTEDILSISDSGSLEEVIAMMEENGIRRIPIIQRNPSGRQKCVGIITLDDLIASEVITTKQLSNIVRSQVVRRLRNFQKTNLDQDQREQTYNRFNKLMASKMNLPRAMAESATFHLLRELVQLLPYTEAAHFISQLPSFYQEDLLDLPAGPNIKIDRNSLIHNLTNEHQLDEESAKDVISSFWQSLEELLDSKLMKSVLENLPESVKGLFLNNRESLSVKPQPEGVPLR